ncbi:hypothetical protein [Paractinoplanes rishiriensis]|nr:hypothetical protein [Actinoplanes rishiriensis]
MSEVENLSLVVGFLSATFVIPVLQQPGWPAQRRAWVTFAYAVVVGFATTWYLGELELTHVTGLRQLATAILMVLVSAIATYKGFTKETGIALRIERATSPASLLAGKRGGEGAA